MSKQIHDYTAATTIDAAADFLLIDPASSGVYNKINRNTLLALASAPLGTTDSQSPQNKTLDNTNSITVKDGSLTIQNSSSTTKQAVFSASGITAGQTRTFTFPDASGTLVTTGATQTLTAKTLTSPAITGGTYDNGTITVDAISGHSVATTVTVANLQIANGVLNTANAVTATSIAIGAIQPQALVSGTGSGWAWSSWTPSWTNLTPGNGVLAYAKYVQIGKTVFGRLHFTLGSTSSVSGQIIFSLPATVNADIVDFTYRGINSVVEVRHAAGPTSIFGLLTFNTNTTAALQYYLQSGTATTLAATSSTAPFTFTTSDIITCNFSYEAA